MSSWLSHELWTLVDKLCRWFMNRVMVYHMSCSFCVWYIVRSTPSWAVRSIEQHRFTCFHPPPPPQPDTSLHCQTTNTVLVQVHHMPAGTRCAYPWRDGQDELTWVTWLHTEMAYPRTVAHLSTNQAELRLTLMQPTMLALDKAANQWLMGCNGK